VGRDRLGGRSDSCAVWRHSTPATGHAQYAGFLSPMIQPSPALPFRQVLRVRSAMQRTELMSQRRQAATRSAETRGQLEEAMRQLAHERTSVTRARALSESSVAEQRLWFSRALTLWEENKRLVARLTAEAQREADRIEAERKMAAEVRAAEARHAEDHKKMGALTNHIRRLTLQLQAERGAVIRERARRARQGARRPSPAVLRGGAAGLRGGAAAYATGGDGETGVGALEAGRVIADGGNADGAEAANAGAACASQHRVGSASALYRPPAPAVESAPDGLSVCVEESSRSFCALVARLSGDPPASDAQPRLEETVGAVSDAGQPSRDEIVGAISGAGLTSLARTSTRSIEGYQAAHGGPATSILGQTNLGSSSMGGSIPACLSRGDPDLGCANQGGAVPGFAANHLATAPLPAVALPPSVGPPAPPSAAAAPSTARTADTHHWACRLALSCEGGAYGTGPPSVHPAPDPLNLDALLRPTASWLAHRASPLPLRQPSPVVLDNDPGLEALLRPTVSWTAHRMSAEQEAELRAQVRRAVAGEAAAARIANRVCAVAVAGSSARAAEGVPATAEGSAAGAPIAAVEVAGLEPACAGVSCTRGAADTPVVASRSMTRTGDPSHRAPGPWAKTACPTGVGAASAHQLPGCTAQAQPTNPAFEHSPPGSGLPSPRPRPSMPAQPAPSSPPHSTPTVAGVFYSSDRQHPPTHQLRPYGARAAAAAACRRELASRAAEQASLYVQARQAAACLGPTLSASHQRSVPAWPSATRSASGPLLPHTAAPTAALGTQQRGVPNAQSSGSGDMRRLAPTGSFEAGLASSTRAPPADASARAPAAAAAATACHFALVADVTVDVTVPSVARPASAPITRTVVPPTHCVSAPVAQVLTARALAGCPPPPPETFAALDLRAAGTQPQFRTSTPDDGAAAAALPRPALSRPQQADATRPALKSAERARSLAAAVHDIRSLLAAVPGLHLQLPEEVMASLPLCGFSASR
jgi:hypothetical protein